MPGLHLMSMSPASRTPQRDLLSGRISTTLMAFSLPTLGAAVLQSVNGSVNAVWVGHTLGESALAATLNGNMILFLLMAFVFGAGQAAMILVGKAVGADDLTEARRVMGTMVGAFAAASVVIAAVGFLASEQILRLLSTPPGAAEMALIYLRVVFLGLPAGLLVTLLMMALRGAGDSLSPLWFTLLSVALDLALNPLLILGVGPFPRLGIAGSALAMTLANAIALGAMVLWIYARDLPIRLGRDELGFLRPNPRLLGEVVGKGLPMGLQMIVMTVAAMSVLGLVNREGVLSTAAYSVAQQLWGYLQMPAMAVAAGVSAMTAQAIGAGDLERARGIARSGIMISLILTLGLVLAMLPLDAPLISLFIGEDSLALPEARHILWTASWGFPFMAVGTVLFAHARAYGVVVRPLLITIIAMFPLRLGFAFGAYGWLQADALWLSVPIGMASTCLLAAGLHALLSARRSAQARTPSAAATAQAAEPSPLPLQ
ncbi:Multidrug export protein MepA [compost metagenome]